jgi:hypothetical protein
VQDVKQYYTGLAPAVARYSPSPQGLMIRPTPHLQSDLLSNREDLADLSYNSMFSTLVVDTPDSHALYSNMPPLVAQSEDEDSDSDDSDPDSGSEADTDAGDDQSDAEVIYDDPIAMPPLVDLSDDDSDGDSDVGDDATDTMSVGSDASDDLHLPTLHHDEDSDDDKPDAFFPLEDSLTSNTPATVRLNTLQPLQQSQDTTLASFMLTTVELLHDSVLLFAGTCMLDTGALQASYCHDFLRNYTHRSMQRHRTAYTSQSPYCATNNDKYLLNILPYLSYFNFSIYSNICLLLMHQYTFSLIF